MKKLKFQKYSPLVLKIFDIRTLLLICSILRADLLHCSFVGVSDRSKGAGRGQFWVERSNSLHPDHWSSSPEASHEHKSRLSRCPWEIWTFIDKIFLERVTDLGKLNFPMVVQF
jgi:hypothetical protein